MCSDYVTHTRATVKYAAMVAVSRRQRRQKNLNARSKNVPNGVTGTHTDPLGKRAVLLLLLPQNLLNLESLVGRLCEENAIISSVHARSGAKPVF